MKKIILLFGLFLSCYAFSQGENNNWYFGHHAGVTFNTNPPTALTDSEMETDEGVATISDSNGNLLFYTNGRTIWNREHEIMENGDSLSGHHSSQQTIILPKPGSSTQYYVFTFPPNEYITTPDYIAYSVVDMDLGEDGTTGALSGLPLGGVDVESDLKNIEILNEFGESFEYLSEAVTAVLHSDNESYWVLIPNGKYLYSYKLNTSGFIDTPVISPLSSDDSFDFEFYGSIKASPLLSDEPYSHLISLTNTISSKWKIYSFNNSIGKLTPHYETGIPTPNNIYSTEFNSDGTLVYGVHNPNGRIWVFDVFSENLKLISEPFSLTGSLQRAVNNNIYVSITNSSTLYHISNPDSFTNSSLNLDIDNPTNIDLGNYNSAIFGLPQLIPLAQFIPLCNDNLILNTPEVSYNLLYEVSNNITTHQNYAVGTNRNITLSAGNMVEILPDSHIKNGSIFRAMIEGCEYVNVPNRKDIKPVRYITNLDDLNKEQATDLKIHPNPTKEIITIVNTTIIDNVTITDMNGRVVKQVVLGTKESQINISDLSQGVYILNATSNEKTFTQKIVKQ